MKTAIVINAETGIASRFDLEDADGNENINAIQNHIGGYMEVIPNGHGMTVFANEDGLLLDLPHNVNASHLCDRHLVGNVIFCGPPDADGDITALTEAHIDLIERM